MATPAREEPGVIPAIEGRRSWLSPGSDTGWHQHDAGQLLWPSTATLRVHTQHGVWIVPPTGALWIPPDERHRRVACIEQRECSLYLPVTCCHALPRQSCLVRVDRALAQAVLEAIGALERGERAEPWLDRLIPAIVDAGVQPLADPCPETSGRLPIVEVARRGGSVDRPLEEWASLMDQSPAALSRALTRATGFSFAAWQRQVRLLGALEALAEGSTVAAAAERAGHRRVPRFVTRFRELTGTTPGQYFGPIAPVRAKRRSAARAAGAPARGRPSPSVGGERSRNDVLFATTTDRSCEGCVVELPAGGQAARHQHNVGELLWAPGGVVRVGTRQGTWVLNESRALWLPPGRDHDVFVPQPVAVHCVFLSAPWRGGSPTHCHAVYVSPALRSALERLRADVDAAPAGEGPFVDLRPEPFEDLCDAEVPPLPLPLAVTSVALARRQPLDRAAR